MFIQDPDKPSVLKEDVSSKDWAIHPYCKPCKNQPKLSPLISTYPSLPEKGPSCSKSCIGAKINLPDMFTICLKSKLNNVSPSTPSSTSKRLNRISTASARQDCIPVAFPLICWIFLALASPKHFPMKLCRISPGEVSLHGQYKFLID